MTEIKWQEPPPAKTKRGKWDDVADQLREAPGRWALIAEGASATLATNIKSGGIVSFLPAGSFEAAQRKAGEGHDIYARFVGEAEVRR